jgi:YVTN family beta-propeller protein
VQCESCHGPGGGYAAEASLDGHDPAPTTTPDVATCRGCHDGAHGAPFELGPALEAIAHPKHPPGQQAAESYKTPLNLAFSPDGRELYVACEASGSLIVVDTERREPVAEIATGGQATDVTVDPRGERAYVSNRLDDTVAVVDLATRTVVERIAVGDEPHGLLFDQPAERLYVLATHEDAIDVVSPQAGERVLRLAAGRRPWSLALSPDGTTFAVTNTLAELAELRQNTHSELTLVDAGRGRVLDRIPLPDTNLVQGVAWHPSGEFVLVTMNRTKSLVPMTRLLQGWTITNGFALVWTDGRVDQLLLDRNDVCFPDAADVACTPDGRLALFVSSGSHRVAVVEIERLLELLRNASDEEREHVLPNHTGAPCEFTVADVPTGRSPRGVAVDPQGRFAYTADSLDDSLTVIDLATLEAVDTIDLGGPEEITKVRWGEQLFHSADIAFRRQFSCHSCHPDGNVDGITYDIEPDGIGLDPVDNRTLRGILDTAPFKWSGLNPSLARQCGPRLAVFFTRVDPFTPEELDALTTYICTIPRPPNRFRPLGADLTPAQRRGKRLFERSFRNDGSPIPPRGRCVTCHPPPLYTDRRKHDLGFLFPYDRSSSFDTPHLNNVYETPPYLHNGAALTLEEIWTRYNPDDLHGVTNDMTKDQLNDLIEFLKTL